MSVKKRELKGLARILGVLTLWMSLGWALYPLLMKDIGTSVGEAINMQEVELFSTIMLAACLVIGMILLVYGFIGRRASGGIQHGHPPKGMDRSSRDDQ
jgi:hypothetical protein